MMEIPYKIDVQVACESEIPVSQTKLFDWINATLQTQKPSAELTLRLVEPEEIAGLNAEYRKINKPTNVLAFPADIPDYIALDYPFLGDVIICPKILAEESLELGISAEAHWAHIVIHGVLHLLGFDHIKDEETEKMQSLEIQLLQYFGFADPYEKEV